MGKSLACIGQIYKTPDRKSLCFRMWAFLCKWPASVGDCGLREVVGPTEFLKRLLDN